MKSILLVTAAAMLAANAPLSIKQRANLDKECERAVGLYLNLSLSVMLEGPVDCSEHGGEFVDCNANETPSEKAARERRLAVRQYQEAGYKPAHDACMAYHQDRKSEPLRQVAVRAIAEARKTDNGILPAKESWGGGSPVPNDPLDNAN